LKSEGCDGRKRQTLLISVGRTSADGIEKSQYREKFFYRKKNEIEVPVKRKGELTG
jgi:hypothetical protein